MNQDIITLSIIRDLKRNQWSTPDWEKAWAKSGPIPKYMTEPQVCRVEGKFRWVHPWTIWEQKLRETFDTYIKKPKKIIELGCGGGANLDILREMFACPVVGYDKAKTSAGLPFDMENPHDIPIDRDTIVLTVSAMEQIGRRWGKLLKLLLAKRPRRVIHMEPLYELYDPDNLLDYLAMEYHRQRGYLWGYLPEIQSLAKQKKVRIVECSRIGFGSKYHEGGSLLIWEPR